MTFNKKKIKTQGPAGNAFIKTKGKMLSKLSPNYFVKWQ